MCGVITKVLKAFMGNDTSEAVCHVLSSNEITNSAVRLRGDWMLTQAFTGSDKAPLTVETHQKKKLKKKLW